MPYFIASARIMIRRFALSISLAASAQAVVGADNAFGTAFAAGNATTPASSNGNVSIGTSSTNRTLTVNGKVGIGGMNAASPDKLQVYGNAVIDGVLGARQQLSAGIADSTSGRNDIRGNHIELAVSQATNQQSFIDFHAAEQTYPDFAGRIARDPGPNANYSLYNRGTGQTVINAMDAGTIGLHTSNIERLRVNPNGEVFIGADPGGNERFRVGGSIRATTVFCKGIYSDSSAILAGAGNMDVRTGLGRLLLRDEWGTVASLASVKADNSAYAPLGLVGSEIRISNKTTIGGAWTGAGATSLLTVSGTITCKEVIVTPNGWADSVYAQPRSLDDLEAVAEHIAEHKHLPGIPSEKEVAVKGISTGDQFARQLAQIEILTLHAIDLKRERDRLSSEVVTLRERLDRAEQNQEQTIRLLAEIGTHLPARQSIDF